MWLGSKIQIVAILLLYPLFGTSQQTEGLLYNLKQNWVQYDTEAKSFMPAISQSNSSTILFLLDGDQYSGQRLYIQNNTEVYFFYDNTLLSKLKKGSHYFSVDSLIILTKKAKPMLSLYGDNVKSNLTTLVVTNLFNQVETDPNDHLQRNKSFTSFFIITSVSLLLALIVIKIKSKDLFVQYTNFSRAFNLTTIEEMIYKGGFFQKASMQFVSWMSFSAAFILYFLIVQLNIHFLEIHWVKQSTMAFHLVHLVIIAIGFLVLFVIRYVLISLVASIFDMTTIKNIHFATHLRLTFYLLLLLQFIITLDYFSVIPFNSTVILLIVIGSLFSIIVLIGIRLSFIIRHPFVQLFLYLCGTEIFLFVFVFKLVIG